jgi:hypothetical protein
MPQKNQGVVMTKPYRMLSRGRFTCDSLPLDAQGKKREKELFATFKDAEDFYKEKKEEDPRLKLQTPYRCRTCLEGTGFHLETVDKNRSGGLRIPRCPIPIDGSQPGRRSDYSGDGRNRHRSRSQSRSKSSRGKRK